MKKLFVITAAIAVLGFAGTATAGPGPTPSGFTGACNMLNAWGVGAQGGMAHGMSVDNPLGNDGMWTAVWNSGNIPGEYVC